MSTVVPLNSLIFTQYLNFSLIKFRIKQEIPWTQGWRGKGFAIWEKLPNNPVKNDLVSRIKLLLTVTADSRAWITDFSHYNPDLKLSRVDLQVELRIDLSSWVNWPEKCMECWHVYLRLTWRSMSTSTPLWNL